MGKGKEELLQGSLDLLVLKVLSLGQNHGYGIMVLITQLSKGVLRLEHGSLYPALYRMEQSDWIQSEWGTTATNRRAKYYTLTPRGAKQLAKEEKKWLSRAQAVRTILGYTGDLVDALD